MTALVRDVPLVSNGRSAICSDAGTVLISASVRAKALHAADIRRANAGDYERATALPEESSVLWREREDRPGIAVTLGNMAKPVISG